MDKKEKKKIIATVQFNYEFGLDTLTSRWGYYTDEETMKKECKMWIEEREGQSYNVYEGYFNPED